MLAIYPHHSALFESPTPCCIMPRLNTRLECEGAEYLVLGRLLLERIPTYKTYTNVPGYDVIATNPDRNRSAESQVKSRWRTNAPGFLIKNFASDFIVFCRLNRGSKSGRLTVREREFFVFPTGVIRAAHREDNWSKVYLRDVENVAQYRDAWHLIGSFLDLPDARSVAATKD